MKKGKRYVESAKLIDRSKQYETGEAIELALQTAKAKFDETMELHVRLGVDPRHADQQVRGVVVLPNGTGKIVGAEEIIQKIQTENWFDFDVCITSPDMMGLVGRIGKLLGPKGLMPNPKSGTVTQDITKAINDVKAGKVEYRVDKTAICHVIFGKKSFGKEKLMENLSTIMDAIIKAKPAAAKGTYVKSVTVSSTMGPGIKVNYRTA